jgi:hypothetical protein
VPSPPSTARNMRRCLPSASIKSVHSVPRRRQKARASTRCLNGFPVETSAAQPRSSPVPCPCGARCSEDTPASAQSSPFGNQLSARPTHPLTSKNSECSYCLRKALQIAVAGFRDYRHSCSGSQSRGQVRSINDDSTRSASLRSHTARAQL